MAPETHTLALGRHTIRVRLTRAARSTAAVVWVDGAEVGEAVGWPLVRIPVADIGEADAAVVVLAVRPGRGAVRLLVPSADGVPGRRQERIDFEPPAGTPAHRRYRWAQAHPRLYAARHVAVAAGQIIAGLVLARLSLGFVLGLDWRWLPDWDLPRIPRPDLPDIPWPDITWPDVDLPDLSLPGWLATVLATKKYWFPILVAVAVGVAEVMRRQRRDAERENTPEEGDQWPVPSTPSDTQRADSSSSTPH